MSAALGLLEVAGLVRQAGGEPEPEYMFRHTLLRDTAYGSLLNEEKRVLHRAVGRAMERIFPHGERELASVLAQHFLTGEIHDKALAYLRLAGDEAARVYALAEALDHYGTALRLAAEGHGSASDLEYLYERRGRMLELAGRYEEALENYRQLESSGKEGSDRRRELRGLARRATLYCIPSAVMNRAKGRELSEQVLALAQEEGDREMESLALWNLMKVEEFGGSLISAREYGERALALAETLDSPDQKAFILNDLVGIHFSAANLKEGKELSRKALELWQELDNLPMLVDAYCNAMGLELAQGNYEEAIGLSEKSISLSEDIDNTWGKSYSRYMLYWIHAERGEVSRSLQVARECIRFAEQAGFVVPTVQTRAEMGLMHAFLGEFEQAHDLIDLAIERSKESFSEWLVLAQEIKALVLVLEGRLEEAEAMLEMIDLSAIPAGLDEFNMVAFLHGLAQGEYLLAKEDWQDALENAEYFLEVFDHFGVRFLKADLYLYQGRACLRMGRAEEARTALAEGKALAEALGSKRSLWRLLDASAAAAHELGDGAAADMNVGRAREVVASIAENTESEQQRDAFLRQVARMSLELGRE